MKKLIIILLSISSLSAADLSDKLVGIWKSQPESKNKFTCSFREENRFTLTAVNNIYDLATEGTFSLKKDDNRTLLHLYDLSFFFVRNTHYGGLVEFIDNNSFKLDLRHTKTDKKLDYPTSFGRNTIIFFRQNRELASK